VARGNSAGGFTLLELLAVIVIIGVVLTFATLSLRGDRRADLLQEEAERLLALTRLAQDEAVLRGEEIGLRVGTDRYEFLTYATDRWVAVEQDAVLRAREVPPELTLELEVEGYKSARDRQGTRAGRASGPDVVLWSSGEVTPFRAVMRVAGAGEGYTLDGTLDGTLTLTRFSDDG
jgi:general secretion pathway protein H